MSGGINFSIGETFVQQDGAELHVEQAGAGSGQRWSTVAAVSGLSKMGSFRNLLSHVLKRSAVTEPGAGWRVIRAFHVDASSAAAIPARRHSRRLTRRRPRNDRNYNTRGAERYFRRARRGLRNRTPSPVPFSSVKSMPAASKACRIAASLAFVTGISPSTTSTRRIVATPTLDAAARSRAVHRSMARAARI